MLFFGLVFCGIMYVFKCGIILSHQSQSPVAIRVTYFIFSLYYIRAVRGTISQSYKLVHILIFIIIILSATSFLFCFSFVCFLCKLRIIPISSQPTNTILATIFTTLFPTNEITSLTTNHHQTVISPILSTNISTIRSSHLLAPIFSSFIDIIDIEDRETDQTAIKSLIISSSSSIELIADFVIIDSLLICVEGQNYSQLLLRNNRSNVLR